MKKLLISVSLAITLFQGNSMAGDLILERTTYPGYVLPPNSVNTNCKLYDNGQVVKEYLVNNLKATGIVPMKFPNVTTIKATITAATWGAIIEKVPPLITDVPTRLYNAYIKQSNGTLKTILLWEGYNKAGQNRYNNSPEAATLKNFIDLNCANSVSGDVPF